MVEPYIKNNSLIIPFDCPHKFKWWAGGQTILETLKELNAPEETMRKYRHDEGIKKGGKPS